MSIPHVHAAENNTIQVAIVGCGGRGTGAVADALSTTSGPIKLVAMADAFADRLKESYDTLAKNFSKQMSVPEDRKFIGLDAYKKAIDCLKSGDVVIFATPMGFRWLHFTYAIEKGINVFMEKPITADGPTTRKMFELAEKSAKKNLKVGVGLMCRHCSARRELFDRIQAGEIGEIITLQSYRMHQAVPAVLAKKTPPSMSEVEHQLRKFHSFLWASAGLFSDLAIHSIDECCWMKNAWPIRAQASGARLYRDDFLDQNFDSYLVEYTFADGTTFNLNGRWINGCYANFSSTAHGSKGTAIISTASHSPAKCKIFKGQRQTKENLAWAYSKPEPSPWQLEWDHLIEAIRNDTPYNEAKRGAEASLVTSMGRMAAHTGQVIEWDDILNSDHEFAPDLANLAMNGLAPLPPDKDGKYPLPMPGIVTKREY